MKDNWIEIAETPFDSSLVRERDGGSGMTFSYVEVKEYIKKLNDMCDYEWGSDIREIIIEHPNAIVSGSIILGNGITKSDTGSGTISIYRDSGKPRKDAVGNAVKAATSDMIKRCCRQIGIGLELYDTDGASSQVHGRETGAEEPLYMSTDAYNNTPKGDRPETYSDNPTVFDIPNPSDRKWTPSEKQINFLKVLGPEIMDRDPQLYDEIKSYLDAGIFDGTGPTASHLIDTAKSLRDKYAQQSI